MTLTEVRVSNTQLPLENGGLMIEEWASLETLGFPGYELSNHGQVKNLRGKMLKTSANQDGIVRVGLMKPNEARQKTVSVLRLVANLYVAGRSATFGTPIQLNGNREDVKAHNILWRPRWFAVKYFRQFDETKEPLFTARIYDVEDSREYTDSREAAKANGLLEEDILLSVANGSPCFPTWQRFSRVSL